MRNIQGQSLPEQLLLPESKLSLSLSLGELLPQSSEEVVEQLEEFCSFEDESEQSLHADSFF